MKSYTDLEQSKKLAEILPLESADMAWCNSSIRGINYTDMPSANLYTVKEMKDVFDEALVGWDKYWKLIPCWSLAALLSVIPKRIKEYNILRIDIGEKDFAIWYDEVGFGVNNDLPNITANNPIDACYEMILKMKELKLL
jgi:hypothetical protein